MDIVAQKICSKCKALKPLVDFPNDKRVRDGKRAECKDCKSAYTKIYRVGRKEKYKIVKRAYYMSHREEIIKKVKEYNLTHPEECRLRTISKRRKKPDKYREHARKGSKKYHNSHPNKKKEWIEKNPHKGAEYNRTRKARLRGDDNKFTAAEWKNVLNKYGNICLRCKRNDVPLAADHVVPVALGGTNRIDNIQPLCKSCNSRKGVRIIDYRPDRIQNENISMVSG